MSSFSLRKQDPVFFTGLIAITVSSGFSLFMVFFPGFRGPERTAFFGAIFAITIGYLIMLIASRRLTKGQNGMFPFLLFLILFLNSAYILNHETKGSDIRPVWFCLALLLVSGNYIAVGLLVKMPEWIRYFLFSLASIAICLFTFKIQ